MIILLANNLLSKKEIIEDVWGNCCLECGLRKEPTIRSYHFETEDVVIISCPACEFTIVVVNLEQGKTDQSPLLTAYP